MQAHGTTVFFFFDDASAERSKSIYARNVPISRSKIGKEREKNASSSGFLLFSLSETRYRGFVYDGKMQQTRLGLGGIVLSE